MAPVLTPQDLFLLNISTGDAAYLTGLQSLQTGNSRYPMPFHGLIIQATVDRLALAGEHLRAGDALLQLDEFRSSIGRFYYAMYHSARSVTFASIPGDDHERHSALPRNLAGPISHLASSLTDARLLRNQADYDPYPVVNDEWETDARSMSVAASTFVADCVQAATTNGWI